MFVHFTKYHGSGNDFVMIDGRKQDLGMLDQEAIKFLCDRRFGIGADGLIILEESEKMDFRMRYFNADGKEGSMCGNGGRCAVAFAVELGITGTQAAFEGIDGPHRALVLPDGEVQLRLGDVEGLRFLEDGYLLDTGSPHFVCFVDDPEQVDVARVGAEIRHQERFGKGGVNVNFVGPGDKAGEITVRTFERGVEAETFSCGTGVTAAAIVAHHHEKSDIFAYRINTLGGTLKVSFQMDDEMRFTEVWLTGPATSVFSGKVEMKG